MRDRLIEMLKMYPCMSTADMDIVDKSKQIFIESIAEDLVDYLLDNGVIVPPCKVRQTVYSQKGCFFLPYEKDINPKEVIPCEVIAIKETKKGQYFLLKPLLIETFGMRSSNEWFPFSAIGKTVYLSREEAEKALKGKDVGK